MESFQDSYSVWNTLRILEQRFSYTTNLVHVKSKEMKDWVLDI